MLYEAMQYVDPVTSQPRGFLRMSAHPLQVCVQFIACVSVCLLLLHVWH